MDADDLEPSRSCVLELVRRLAADHDNVARSRLELLAVDGDANRSSADDPRLRIRMRVEVRALTWLVVDEEEETADL